MTPKEVKFILPVEQDKPDDFLILSSSWEERCLGVAERLKFYSSNKILINVYDNPTPKKEEIYKELKKMLIHKGEIQAVNSKQSNPLDGIKRMLYHIKTNFKNGIPKISFDISCFTRKHLLQLLNCLECNGLLGNTNFYYSQPTDYYSENNSSNAEGISSISVTETFSGENLSSRDTALIIFLNFEGRRALALWQELQPNVAMPIIPFPSIKAEWGDRVENQNRLLLSTLNLNWEDLEKSSPLDPDFTKELLLKLTSLKLEENKILKHSNYNFIIAPLGTKPQVLGVFKYWRIFPDKVSIVYPSPIKYKDIPESFPTEKTWLIDKSINWEIN
jgi:hypothetical protein